MMERYNIIKIFIVGSTSLAHRRRDLAELAYKYNINSIRGKKNVKDIIFIYSYEDTGSPEQNDYDKIISTESDVVITILEDELGKISYNEAKLALETNIKTNGVRPIVYGMINTENIHNEVSVEAVSRHHKAVLEKCHQPTDKNHGYQADALEFALEHHLTIPRQGHKQVRAYQKSYCGESSSNHNRFVLKLRIEN